MNDDESMRQARLLMAMMDSGKARIEPTDPDDGIGVAWIRVHDAIVVAVEPLAAALARADAAERECAELNDALDKARGLIDDALASVRRRDQVAGWAQAAAAVVGAIDVEHLTRQAEFSQRTFGPGLRTRGVIDHITKEFDEILADPEVIDEWVDVIILGFDGALRTGAAPAKVIAAVKAKQAKNEARVWPDFRDFGEDEAIEHDRGIA